MASFMEKAIPERTNSGIRMILFFVATNSLTDIAYPFTILAAGLYTLHGTSVYLFFMSGAFLVSVLAHRLSQAAQQSQQRTNELDALEKLGRAIINSPPDATLLPDLLQEYIPSMMVRTLAVVWFLPDRIIFQSATAGDSLPQFDVARQMVQELDVPFGRLHKILATTSTRPFAYKHEGIVLPIRTEAGNLLGGIYVLQRQDVGDVEDFVPALQSLAAQLASAVHREQVHLETLQRQKMAQELAFAGRIQQSFLPKEIPQHPNWDFAATLIPARQTSGDFYDFVPLGDGRLGLIVADVADKGTGAALYMALSRTLIRTYAMQFPDEPGKALQLANERILSDTESDQFVTVFYGVLELENGRFTYANAGHNPTYLIGSETKSLTKTGIPLGIFEDTEWQQETVEICVGESLILYSDGVPEAQNSRQEEFGEAQMLAVAQQGANGSATARQTAITEAVSQFVGDAPQFDDITLMVATRLK
jgi:serine phosphatase RsbU (regulator of sigma subunit)